MGYYRHLGVFYNVHYAVTSCIAFYLVGRQLVCEIKLHNVKLNKKKIINNKAQFCIQMQTT